MMPRSAIGRRTLFQLAGWAAASRIAAAEQASGPSPSQFISGRSDRGRRFRRRGNYRGGKWIPGRRLNGDENDQGGRIVYRYE
jgi:hypothetical protein